MVRGLDVFFMVCGSILPVASILLPTIGGIEGTISKRSHIFGLVGLACLALFAWIRAATHDYKDLAEINLAFAVSTPQVLYAVHMWWKWCVNRQKAEIPRAEVVSHREDW